MLTQLREGEPKIVSVVCKRTTLTEERLAPPVFFLKIVIWAVRALKRYVMHSPETVVKVDDMPLYLYLREKV